MSGYLHFDKTGVKVIDDILEAIEFAGTLFHHTESWGDGWPEDSDESPSERIQVAAKRAAAFITRQGQGRVR